MSQQTHRLVSSTTVCGITDLPPQITVDLAQDLRSYWRERIRQHTSDVYAGVPLSKFPEDLRTYEHLLWSDRPDTIIEIGTQYGGSALWFRDRLRTLESYGLIGAPRVITVDIDQAAARTHLSRADAEYADTIHILEGDVRDAAIAEQVGEFIGERCLVVEDSAHEFETTLAALTTFAGFVPPGGYFVVEDGSVDAETLRITDDWPRGVLPAVWDWLQTPEGREFDVRRDLEVYGITSHPNGFLQRSRELRSRLRRDSGQDPPVPPHPLEREHRQVDTLAERELAETRLSLKESVEERRRLSERLVDAERRLVDAERRLAVVPGLEQRIAELEQELRHAAQRERAGAEVLASVLDSRSWRLTKPLRAVKRLVGRRVA